MVSEFFCTKIFSQNLFKSPLFSSSEVQAFPLFCFYGKRKNSKELNDCSIKNRVKRHEKTSFPAGSRFSGTAFPNIFGDESAIDMCTPFQRAACALLYNTTETGFAVLCPTRLQNWTGTVSVNFCAELFRRKTKFRRVLPSLCINNF